MIIISIVLAFALIIFLLQKNYSIGSATVLGGIVLALLSGISVPEIFLIIRKVCLDLGTFDLVLSVVLISVLGNATLSYGVMETLVNYLGKTFKSTKHLLFVIPSMLSAFTAPGSAIVAAPVIEGIGSKIGLANSRKAAINLYIRHVWYFIMPISFPLVYAAHLAQVPIWSMIKIQFPLTVVGLITAYMVYINPIQEESQDSISSGQDIGKIFYYSSPLWLSILFTIWFPFNISLFIGCIMAFLIRTQPGNLKEILINKQNWNMAYATIGTLIFKGIIDSIPAIKELIIVIIEAGIPLELVIILSAVVLGAVLANPITLVGSLYPIFLPLVPSNQYLATAMLIFVLGFVGYFISPIHLCQVLTNQYFKVRADELYKEYRITIPVLFASMLMTYWILRLVG